ncbi:hypothetical protein ACOMHN_037296 [Nucella lapillus]
MQKVHDGLRDCVGFPIFHLNVCSEFNLPYPFINDSAKDHKFLLNCHIYRFIQHDAYVGAVFNPREDLLSAHIAQRGLKLCCLVVVSVGWLAAAWLPPGCSCVLTKAWNK